MDCSLTAAQWQPVFKEEPDDLGIPLSRSEGIHSRLSLTPDSTGASSYGTSLTHSLHAITIAA
jgi:hypothetical protein